MVKLEQQVEVAGGGEEEDLQQEVMEQVDEWKSNVEMREGEDEEEEVEIK